MYVNKIKLQNDFLKIYKGKIWCGGWLYIAFEGVLTD